MGLDLLHSIGVTTNHLLHGSENRLTLVETAGTEGVERAFSIEVLGQVDEDQNFTDTGMNEEDGGLITSSLKRNDGVVYVSVRGRRVENLVDQSGEQVGGWMQQDAENGNLVGKLHGHFDFALESVSYEMIKSGFPDNYNAILPDDVNARSTHLEEVVLYRHAARIQIEDAFKDSTNLFCNRTRGGPDELLAATQL